MKINHFYNEDCRNTIERMRERDFKIEGVITSPPYNTSSNSSKIDHHNRYDAYNDIISNENYYDFMLSLFDGFYDILKENGVVLWNINYGNVNPNAMWVLMGLIADDTDFTIADDIIWFKSNAMPNVGSSNKLTRIVEHVFVLCRDEEFKTFNSNKELSMVASNGAKIYKPINNVVYAKNNDGSNPFNKATYSIDLVGQLIDLYFKKGDLIYDPFMGTGTTALACRMKGLNYIGSEISHNQVDYSIERLKEVQITL